ncbi:DUF5693 family protein [Thermolongibacillus altinsuensis]
MKKWIWLAIAITLVWTASAIYSRHEAEWKNRSYEIMMPYDQIQEAVQSSAEEDKLLARLKKAGLTSISIEAETLHSLEKAGVVFTFERDELLKSLIIADESFSMPDLPSEGLFIYIHDTSFPVRQALEQVFDEQLSTMKIGKRTYYFVEGNPEKLKDIPFGYNEQVIDRLTDQGFQVVLRLPDARYMTETNEFVLEQITSLKGERVNKLLPTGEEIAGFPNGLQKWGKRWKEAGYALLSIEFTDMKGFVTVAKAMDAQVVRLHSLNLERRDPAEAVDVAIRAVKERNIRAIFLRMDSSKAPDKRINMAVNVIENIVKQMPSHYEAGASHPFAPIHQSLATKAMVVLGVSLFLFLATAQLLPRLVAYAAFVGSFVLGALSMFTSISLFEQLLALGVGVLTPVYAAIPSSPIRRTKDIVWTYMRSIGISFVGIWWIVSLLYGNEYLAYIGEGFRGVKLVYVVPILFVAAYVLWPYISKNPLAFAKKQLLEPVKYWHLLVFAVGGAVFLYYISRTGNVGAASPLELAFRQKLEEWLYVRPRTKEFLLGFPVYVFALYLLKENMKKASFLLVIGVIGWLSIVNTFTHLHIPLYVSFIRTLYSLILGALIGSIMIGMYRIFLKKRGMA